MILALACSLLLAASCSIKEERVECPCYLDMTVLRQPESMLPGGNAWSSVWAADEMVFSHPLSNMNVRDTTLECRIFPKVMVRSVVSSHVPAGRVVRAEYGSQMVPAYAYGKEVACFDELAQVEMDQLDKRYCTVSLSLTEEAAEFAHLLSVTVEAPYDGFVLPSMKASEGKFRYAANFDEEGAISFRIPPQGGEGLRMVIRIEGGATSSFDLYGLMKEALYDWDAWSLRDFSATVGLNSVSESFGITDWSVVDIEHRDF